MDIERLRDARAAAGLHLSEIAALAECDTSTVCYVLGGRLSAAPVAMRVRRALVTLLVARQREIAAHVAELVS